jgi:nucleoside-diphosphate-sugar epimerase
MNEPRQGDIRNSKSNITAISDELGYVPKFTLEEGLQALYESL